MNDIQMTRNVLIYVDKIIVNLLSLLHPRSVCFLNQRYPVPLNFDEN